MLKNSHCVNKSKGFLVTGEPVIILLYTADSANLSIFLVLLADGVLIVVDSSIAINVLCEDKNFLAGLNVHKGHVTYKAVADAFGHEFVEPLSILR